MHKLVKYLYYFEALAHSFINKYVQSKLSEIYWLAIFEPNLASKSIAI